MTRQEELKVLIPHLRQKVKFLGENINSSSISSKSYIDELRYTLDDLSEKVTDLQELDEEMKAVIPKPDTEDDLPF